MARKPTALPQTHFLISVPNRAHTPKRLPARSRTAANVGNHGHMFAEKTVRPGPDGIFVRHNHRKGNSLCVRSDPSQREDVVPVEARVGHLHPDPPFGDLRFGSVAHDKSAHWIV